jgi:DNA-binding CsgD family transcriptional regulator
LTQRESEVLQLLSQGLTNKEIAAELAVSAHTAKFHVNGILEKLGAMTRTEAVTIAVRSGLVHL